MTRRVIVPILMVAALATPCLAGNAEEGVAEQLARELVRLQLPPSSLDEMYVQATQAAVVNFENGIQPAIKRALTENEKQRLVLFWRKEIEAMLPYSSLEDLIVPVVTKNLTLDELQEIIKFSNSPAGRKLAEVQPIISREARSSGEMFARKFADKDWQARIAAELKEQFPQWYAKPEGGE